MRTLSNIRYTALFIAGAHLLFACSSEPDLRTALSELPAKHLGFYDFEASVALAERVGDAPEELLELYVAAGETDLRRYQPDSAEREQLARTISMLPERHHDVLQDRLLGIYCIENLSGSGMADWILGPDDEIYAVLLLNPRVFRMSAAELLSFRLNTAFREDGSGTEVSVDLPDEMSALTYILMHEATHIVDYTERHTPYVEPTMLTLLGRSASNTEFTDEVWQGYNEVLPEVRFEQQPDLRFYGLRGEPIFTRQDAVRVLRDLAESPFASLYAASNWAEDFAEFVTFYYFVRELDAEYVILVERNGKELFSYEPMRSPAVLERTGGIDPELVKAPGR